MISLVLVCFMVFCIGVVPLYVAPMLLAPVFQRIRLAPSRTQYRTPDVASLFLLLAVSAGGASRLLRGDEPAALVFLLITAWTAVIGIWWISVRELSHANVDSNFHRALFELILVPIAYVGPFVALGALFALIGGAALNVSLPVLIAAVVALKACPIGSRWIWSRTELRRYQDAPPEDRVWRSD